MNVVVPENPDMITTRQHRKLLRAVNLIKEKRFGKIKGRTCADGSTQMGYIPRENASTPTISLEALMETLVIDAYEGQYVAIFDVPGAHLNVDMTDMKYDRLKLEGKLVDIMSGANPYAIPIGRLTKIGRAS